MNVVVAAAVAAAVAVMTCGVGVQPAPAAASAAAVGEPACFGAAARDPQDPCTSTATAIFPPLADIDADYVGGSRCNPVPGNPAPICAFGVPRSKARRHFALLGDSHALHWRRAIDVVALAERWRGYSITTAACPFTSAVSRLPAGLRGYCKEWFRTARAWFRDHPEVSVVFVSQFAPLAIEPPRGRTIGQTKIAHFKRTWRSLPRTVKHVVTIRDNPLTTQATVDCVNAAIDAGGDPASACSEGREYAVPWDTAVSAARSLRSRRYASIDLTEFFCDKRRCYPVIGGARVYRDAFGHLTTAYSRTLGPFLHRKLRALMRRW